MWPFQKHHTNYFTWMCWSVLIFLIYGRRHTFDIESPHFHYVPYRDFQWWEMELLFLCCETPLFSFNYCISIWMFSSYILASYWFSFAFYEIGFKNGMVIFGWVGDRDGGMSDPNVKSVSSHNAMNLQSLIVRKRRTTGLRISASLFQYPGQKT